MDTMVKNFFENAKHVFNAQQSLQMGCPERCQMCLGHLQKAGRAPGAKTWLQTEIPQTKYEIKIPQRCHKIIC